MRETLKDWKRDRIETNGETNEIGRQSMKGKVKILYNEVKQNFDILGSYLRTTQDEHYINAYYGTNVLDPAIGYWDFEDCEGNKYSFMDYEESAQESMERFKKNFPSWKIITVVE